MANYIRNPTWADGSGGATPITAAKLNNIEDGIYAAHFTPCVRAYHSTTQAIANSSLTILNCNSELFDTDSNHDTVTNNSRLTCKTAGKYQITSIVAWPSNATGYRRLAIPLNGSTVTYVGESHVLPITGR